jgi:acyl-CoA ligase (AMP-forming) (exosortase A-associated)
VTAVAPSSRQPVNASAESSSRSKRRIEDSLLHRAENVAEKAAIVDGDRPCSYAQLAARARRLAGQLRERGLEPGHRVAIYLDKSEEAVVALYGAWMAGGVAVPVNEGLLSRQVEHIVQHSGSRLLVSHPRRLARLDGAATAGAEIVQVDDGEAAMWKPEQLPGGREPAAILYTSGSTGRPKGILISHDNLLAGARIVSSYLAIQPDERIISILPFSFDYGLNQLLTAVDCGATLFLQRSHFPADICRTLERHAITAMGAVPPLWIQLMQDHSPLRQMTLPHLRYITNTGGVFPVELVARYRQHLPRTRIYLMYGLSEAFRSTYLPPDQVDRRPGSMGRAIPETEIHVLDRDGRECEPGQAGELVHRGPTVALGYWRDPAATAAVFRPSPLSGSDAGERVVHSGDMVRRDEEGFLYFAGRRDQLIKCQGFRVSPDEVEEILYESGLVAEAAVCGVPDEALGQAIVAHVVPRDASAFTESALLTFCRREMPRYMIPRAVRTHATLPRTASGKIDRKRVAP